MDNFSFRFIKDELIKGNDAFIQNVDNFLFSFYFKQLENNLLNNNLSFLFRDIKSLIMGGSVITGLQKENKRGDKLFLLPSDTHISIRNKVINIMDLIKTESLGFSELEVLLILYCLFVNGLDKTKGEKFDIIKDILHPLIKKLKEIFYEFHHNELHEGRIFILAILSPAGASDEPFYIINNEKDMLEYEDQYDCMKVLELIDSRKRNFDSIFCDRTKKDYTFLLRKENYRYVLDLYLYSSGNKENWYRL